jgi:hypothetical protein
LQQQGVKYRGVTEVDDTVEDWRGSGAVGYSRAYERPATLDDLLAKYGHGEEVLGDTWNVDDQMVPSSSTKQHYHDYHHQQQQQRRRHSGMPVRPRSSSPELVHQYQQQRLVARSRLSPDLEQQQEQQVFRELVQLRGALVAADAANERIRGIVGVLRKEMEALQASGG